MKKILILTLGTGSVFGDQQDSGNVEDRLRNMIEEKQYPYRKTDYIFQAAGMEPEVMQSEYVAEIEIKKYQPDMVMILGTVKSGWGMFYRKFTQDAGIDEQTLFTDVMTLHKIETTYGKDTGTEELKRLEADIQKIYSRGLVLSRQKTVEIKICLIRYGINQEELLENYQHIGTIESWLDKAEEYEVAFDITHSFRSLPIYNLVILNYMQQISMHKITLKHIFYGNFDVKRENDGKAPVVDLADIAEVLNLTNGVSEFKNTGNARTLLQMLPETEDTLREALGKFDWATQINGRNEVVEAIRDLADALEDTPDEKNRFTDAKKMLRVMLNEEKGGLLNIAKCSSRGEAQLLLANWYQRQNRYGLAAATALEALRSFLVPCYLKAFGGEETDYENENSRKAAVHRLDMIKKRKSCWIPSEITEFLVRLKQSKDRVAKVRNIFAHNLIAEKSVKEESAKGIIDGLLADLDQLKQYLRDREEEFQRVYCYVPVTAPPKVMVGNIRVYISDQRGLPGGAELKKLKQTAAGKAYTVYRLPGEIVNQLKCKAAKDLIRCGHLLSEYLSSYFDIEKVHIVFDGGMSERSRLNYGLILYKHGFEYLYCLQELHIQRLAKPAVGIEYNEKEVVIEPHLLQQKPVKCSE